MKLPPAARLAAVSAVAALTAAVFAGPALAGSPPSANAGLQALRDYNLIVLGNMSTNGDVEGRTLVTGGLTGTGNFFTSPHGETTATLPGLIVGGAINASSENLNNGSGAWVGGSLTGQLNLNGGGHVLVGGAINTSQNSPASFTANDGAAALAGLPMSLADYATSLKALSSAFSTMATTQPNPASLVSNNLNIDVTGGGTGLAVIDISDALLSGNQISINTEGYNTVVINVAGAADSYSFNPGAFSANAQTKIIWNFYQATTLSISGQFEGSILAPLAQLTNNTQVNGSVAVAGFQQGGEVHMANYAGTYQFPGVPEPAGWALMLLGFGGAGGLLRRRRRTAAGA